MKKIIFSIATVLSCGLLASCGTAGNTGNTTQNNGTAELLGAVAGNIIAGQTGIDGNTVANAGNILGNIISTFGSGVSTNQSSLIGTWTYEKPCIQFESESLLAKAGGTLLANKVEEKLESYYQKLGIKAGNCKYVFEKDNTVKYTFGGRTYQGTYKFDSKKRQVSITSALGTTVTAYVSITGNHMGLTFDASKLLTLLQSASAASSHLGTISAISSSYSGMKAGVQFKK